MMGNLHKILWRQLFTINQDDSLNLSIFENEIRIMRDRISYLLPQLSIINTIEAFESRIVSSAQNGEISL